MRLWRDAKIDLSQRVLHTRYERSIWRSLSVDTCGKPMQAIAQQHAPAPYATAHDLYSHRYPLPVSSTAFLRPASTRGDQAVHAVRCRRNSCVRACLAARGLTCLTKREQRAQRARRGALPHTLPRPGCGRCSRRRAEGEAAAERLKRFSSRLAECNVRPAPAVHCGVGFALPCDAEARREPSRAVS